MSPKAWQGQGQASRSGWSLDPAIRVDEAARAGPYAGANLSTVAIVSPPGGG
jgi:hypothetical protein